MRAPGLGGSMISNMKLYKLITLFQFTFTLLAFLAATAGVSAGDDFPFSFKVTVNKGDKPISKGVRLADGHLRTNGNLLAAVNFGSATNTLRGPGAAILFVSTNASNPFRDQLVHGRAECGSQLERQRYRF